MVLQRIRRTLRKPDAGQPELYREYMRHRGRTDQPDAGATASEILAEGRELARRRSTKMPS